MTIFLTAAVTLLVTVVAGLILDYFRRARARIVYHIRNAIPIRLDDKIIGSYLIELANQSKQTIRDVTCHVKAIPAALKNGGIWTSQGLQYSLSEEDGILLTIPYLNQSEEIQLTVVAESSAFVPETPDVAIRAPQQFRLVKVRKITERKWFKSTFMSGSIAAFVAGLAVTLATSGFLFQIERPRDTLSYAAAVSGLPQLSFIYSTSSNVNYYNQGDVAFAYAFQAKDAAEIDKYRSFILITLERSPRMMDRSQSALYYNLRKIDLLMKDKEKAIMHFRRAYDLAPSLIKGRLEIEENIKQYFIDNALMK